MIKDQCSCTFLNNWRNFEIQSDVKATTEISLKIIRKSEGRQITNEGNSGKERKSTEEKGVYGGGGQSKRFLTTMTSVYVLWT